MSEAEASAPAGAQTIARPKSHVLRSVLILLIALAVFGAAMWYTGGIDYVMGLLGGATPGSPNTSQPAASAAASSTASSSTGSLNLPAGVDEALAKRMYVEQIESTNNLAKMAKGDVARFAINGVDATDTTATISLSVSFKDGTSAPGVMYLVKRSGSWYFLAIGGMNLPNASGLAGGVATGGSTEITEQNLPDVAEGMSQAGISTFDLGVINTILSQQTVNQPMLQALVGGTYNTMELGAPTAGLGTASVPVTLTGKGGASAKGQLALIAKTIDGHDFTFLTTFKKL
jgi:hypothetical protein